MEAIRCDQRRVADVTAAAEVPLADVGGVVAGLLQLVAKTGIMLREYIKMNL